MPAAQFKKERDRCGGLGLHELLLGELLGREAALRRLLLIELVEAAAPLLPEAGQLVLLRLLPVHLGPLPLHLRLLMAKSCRPTKPRLDSEGRARTQQFEF